MDRYSQQWHARQAQLVTRAQRGMRYTRDRSDHTLNMSAAAIVVAGTTDRLAFASHRRQSLHRLQRERAAWRGLNLPTRANNLALIERAIRNVLRGVAA